MTFELGNAGRSERLAEKEDLPGLSLYSLSKLALSESPKLAYVAGQKDTLAEEAGWSGWFDWIPDAFGRRHKLEKVPYTGARDGSSKAVLGVAQERLHDEIYRGNYMDATKNGRLACAIAVSTVFRESGLKSAGDKPFPLRLATKNTREDLLNAGWKVVDSSSDTPKPGYFVEAFGALDGSGAHHAIIVGEAAKRGQRHPVTGVAYKEGEVMAWNNNDRTRPDMPGQEKLKWWGLESLAEATAEYSNYFALRPPNPGEKLTVAAEKEKVRRILAGR